MKRIVVIGTGKMLVDCLRTIERTARAVVLLAVGEPSTSAWGDAVGSHCRSVGIPFHAAPVLNSDDVVARVSEAQPDLILSINNLRILKRPLFSLPPEGTINFHNGPLPRYGGVNPCSWAIINGEHEHGITWHYVDDGIDTGDVIAQRSLAIAPDETARSLITRCINLGIESFGEILPGILDGSAGRHPQDLSQSTYFGRKDLPHGGRVDFAWSYLQLDRFIRGLSFHPMPSLYVTPKSTFRGRDFYIERIATAHSALAGDPGRVVAIEHDRIDVAIADAVIGITQVLDEAENDITVQDFVACYGITVGDRLGE